jgi:hypothetical protein
MVMMRRCSGDVKFFVSYQARAGALYSSLSLSQRNSLANLPVPLSLSPCRAAASQIVMQRLE